LCASTAQWRRHPTSYKNCEMNKVVIAILVIAGVAGAAGAGYWYGTRNPGLQGGATAAQAAANAQGKGGAGAANAPAQAIVVEATRVVTTAIPQTITAVGSLRSDESVTLRPESAGRISNITFQEGQRVVKGVPLVRLDPAIPQAELQQAKANYTLAKQKYDRATDLAKRNFISGQAKDEADNNMKVAEASVQLAEAKLAKTDIRAPFSGIIGLRSVSIGDYVKEGADLVNLEAIDPLKVDFRVPETYLRQVQVGQALQVTLDALPGKAYDGKVVALNPLIDAAGRAIVIRAQVRNQDTALRPGMFARVKLITRSERDALMLPEQALVPLGTEQFVFRVTDGKVTRVKVETGQRREGKVEIVSGVNKEDLIVTAGQLKLRDGATVKVTGSQPRDGPDAVSAAPAPPPSPGSVSGLVTPATAGPARPAPRT
jgi:membrane fusion protein (multidrug efflux system)